jgi:hypothetical protein
MNFSEWTAEDVAAKLGLEKHRDGLCRRSPQAPPRAVDRDAGHVRSEALCEQIPAARLPKSQ